MDSDTISALVWAFAPWHDDEELNVFAGFLKTVKLEGDLDHVYWGPSNKTGSYQIRLSDDLNNEVILDDKLSLDEACAKCASIAEELGVSIPELPKEFR